MEGAKESDDLLIYLSAIELESDKAKFAQIYEHYRYTMLHTAMKVLKDQDLAEDAVHNACLKIIEYLHKFSDLSSSKTKSLIVIITKNKAIDILRKEQGLSIIPLEDVEYALQDNDSDPLESLISEQGYQRLLDAIDKLGDTYKTTLQLKYIHGYTNNEMAQLLDISLDNINTRLYRAKVLLKEKLKKEGKDLD